MTDNKHTSADLKQMQSLPLEIKIEMSKQRIRKWYESWHCYGLYNKSTKKTRRVAAVEEPQLRKNEEIIDVKNGAVYVSFSGGKDSTVLKHLVDSMYDDVPAVFFDTGLEYPEIRNFAIAQENVVVLRPDMPFNEVIKKYGYPIISKEIAKKVHDAKTAEKYGTDSYALRQFDGSYRSQDGKNSSYIYI